MMGDGKPVNWKDVALKTFWTAVSTGGATLLAYVVALPYGWVPVAALLINAGLAWVRQQVGATPPEAPNTNASVLR